MNPRYLLIAAVPSILSLALYVTLAMHMHLVLGGWPESIGYAGLPNALVAHSNIQITFFTLLLLLALTVCPLGALICAFIEKARFLSIYLISASLIFILSFALMQLAPPEFLYWWWD
jgi:hypothetical protein